MRTVIQNRIEQLMTPVLQVVSWGLVALTDAARLWSDPEDLPPGEESVTLWGLGFTAVLAVLSTTAMTMFWKSRILVWDDQVEVVNPLKVYRFHLSRLEKVDSHFTRFPHLHVAGEVIRAVGVQHSLRMSMKRGDHRLSRELDDLAARAGTVVPGPAGLQVERRSMTAVELVFMGAWAVRDCCTNG